MYKLNTILIENIYKHRNLIENMYKYREEDDIINMLHNYSVRKVPSHKMDSVWFLSLCVCWSFILDADWFAARLLCARHMLGQGTGTIVEEWFGTLIWVINAYA